MFWHILCGIPYRTERNCPPPPHLCGCSCAIQEACKAGSRDSCISCFPLYLPSDAGSKMVPRNPFLVSCNNPQGPLRCIVHLRLLRRSTSHDIPCVRLCNACCCQLWVQCDPMSWQYSSRSVILHWCLIPTPPHPALTSYGKHVR